MTRSQGQILLTGTYRSGTTYAALLLSNHPGVFDQRDPGVLHSVAVHDRSVRAHERVAQLGTLAGRQKPRPVPRRVI